MANENTKYAFFYSPGRKKRQVAFGSHFSYTEFSCERYEEEGDQMLPADLELDIATGLEYCANSEEVYLDIINEFRLDDRRDELNEFFAARNWERYRISAHAVKSSALTIGAMKLHEIAKQIEEPLKQMDFTPALRLHDSFIACYTEVMEMLARVLG